MASPTTRLELKDYCLRKLGFPVIDINVDDDQLEDRIDDALQKYKEFHYDGTETLYLAHKITNADILNKYVTLADSIIGISRVFPFTGSSVASTSSSGFNIFDINYQLRLNDFYNLTSSSYTYYVIAREHLSMLDMIVTGEFPYTYNKKVNRINVLTDWAGKFLVGNYLCFQATRVVDPESYGKVFGDTWMKKYTTALFKQQWGANITKYANYTLPGGLVVNGEKIYNDAAIEVAALEDELREVYEEPAQMLVG